MYTNAYRCAVGQVAVQVVQSLCRLRDYPKFAIPIFAPFYTRLYRVTLRKQSRHSSTVLYSTAFHIRVIRNEFGLLSSARALVACNMRADKYSLLVAAVYP